MQASAHRCLLCLALALAACGPTAAYRRQRPAVEVHATKQQTAGTAGNLTAEVKVEDVQKVRKKLEVVATNLEGMLKVNDGELAKSQVAPSMQAFVKELKEVLAVTNITEDPTAAMKKLQHAAAGVAVLVREMTARQEFLMKEDETQHESLLLGVLMTRQQQPMEKQLEVLWSSDFANLTVCKALLAAHNSSKALYLQAADFLDKNRGKKAATAEKENAVERAAKIEKLAGALESRVHSMEKDLTEKNVSHQKRVQLLEGRADHATSKTTKHILQTLKKSEVRKFKKFSLVRTKDIASMKTAVEAVRRGDMKALERAKAALEASMQALKDQNGGFLVLLSYGHRTLGADCPYCAAQCIDKCRQVGNSYVQCLGSCAEAGKA